MQQEMNEIGKNSVPELTADEILKLKKEKLAEIKKIKNDIKMLASGFKKDPVVGFVFPGVQIDTS
jgi:hypothetical protein